MKRADKIRGMTDEQLAEYLYDYEALYCQYRPECGEMLNRSVEIPEELCKECMLKWLQKKEDA